MPFLTRIAGATALFLTTAVILIGPWVYGAWEMWGFWPLATALFAAAGFLGLRMVLTALRADHPGDDTASAANGTCGQSVWWLLAACLPFLGYVFIRFLQTPVHLLAERAFLLHLTGVLVAVLICATTSARARQVIFALIALDLFLLGAYGLANHFITGNRYVLGVPGFPQYYNENRATGSYFCPDHFAGIMEFGVCLGVAAVCFGNAWRVRLAGVLLGFLGITGVVLSKSRGGGLTLVVLAVAALIWGFAHLPRAVRVWWRLCAVSALLCAAILVACFAEGYVQRFGQYVGWRHASNKAPREALAFALTVLQRQDRPLMFAGAIRAWRTAPWFGIGPGMHSVLWPHFAPTPDGDRASGRWPSLPNNVYTSNAVHNDWLQLLEECGILGFALFLIPAGLVTGAVRRRLRTAGARLAADPRDTAARADAAQALAGLLAIVTMAFHSLGDFNLQMPATTWLLAALIALPLAAPSNAAAKADS